MSDEGDALTKLKSNPENWNAMLRNFNNKIKDKEWTVSSIASTAECSTATVYRFLKSNSDKPSVSTKAIKSILVAFGTSAVLELDRIECGKNNEVIKDNNHQPWIIDSDRAASLLSMQKGSVFFRIDDWCFRKSSGEVQNFRLSDNIELLAKNKIIGKAQLKRKLIVLSGQAGLGKTIFFHRYVCQFKNSLMIDISKFINANKATDKENFGFELMEQKISEVYKLHVKNNNKAPIIIDHLVPAIRDHAVSRGEKWINLLDRTLEIFENIVRHHATPLIIIFDARCDGGSDPDAEEILQRMNLNKLEISIQPAKLQAIIDDLTKKQIEMSAEPNHKNLAIFLDSYYKTRASDKAFIEIIADAEKHGDQHFLREIAGDVVQWVGRLNNLDTQAANNNLRKKNIKDCVSLIARELTWDWLFLSKIGYSKAYVVDTLRKLHNILGRGPFRETMALSNIISLLSYWDAYEKSDLNRIYFHSNLKRAFFKSGTISNAQFHSVDLAQVFWERGFELQDVSFIGCLFEELTFGTVDELSKRGCCTLEGCYCIVKEDCSDYTVVRKAE